MATILQVFFAGDIYLRLHKVAILLWIKKYPVLSIFKNKNTSIEVVLKLSIYFKTTPYKLM